MNLKDDTYYIVLLLYKIEINSDQPHGSLTSDLQTSMNRRLKTTGVDKYF